MCVGLTVEADVASETVFTVSGATAKVAQRIGLAEAGLRERDHLQEWVIAHPQVLGPDVKIVAFEFGRWSGSSGDRDWDRLDILALDQDGRLVVVELKRDKAPDTVEMQALKYAALVSRFTRDDLNRVHAQYLARRRGEPVEADEAAAELDEWSSITEESLRLPRIVLMASSFPKTVTATVVFLHQQLALDVRLLVFQAYRTEGGEVLITVSQHYPPPEVEDFVLSPEVVEARQARTERQTQQREASTVSRLVGAGVLEPGERLEFRAPSTDLQTQIEPWLTTDPRRRWATWEDEPVRPLKWQADGRFYTPSGLAKHILSEAADRTSQVQGPLYWTTATGATLVELARGLNSADDIPFEQRLEVAAPELQPLLIALDESILDLGTGVTRRSRPKSLIYYGHRKLCDVLLHGDHLSVYIQGLDVNGTYPPGVVVGGTEKYIHTQIRDSAGLEHVMALLSRAYTTHQA
jgi:hypothetical protein